MFKKISLKSISDVLSSKELKNIKGGSYGLCTVTCDGQTITSPYRSCASIAESCNGPYECSDDCY
jgi:natural product precursor